MGHGGRGACLCGFKLAVALAGPAAWPQRSPGAFPAPTSCGSQRDPGAAAPQYRKDCGQRVGACRPWAHAWGQCREVHTSPGSLHTLSCWAAVASHPRQALVGQWWKAGARFSASWDEVPADSPRVWSPDLGPLNLFRATASRERLPQRATGLSPPDPSWKAGALLCRGAAPVF